MLSGETANGEYSVEAVKMMAGTCVEAESLVDYDATYTDIRSKVLQLLDMPSYYSIGLYLTRGIE
jgi:pyruvate kinase